MSSDITTEVQTGKTLSKATFRSQALSIAGGMLKEWVGEDRAMEAAGRISVALAAARSMAKNPKDFDECTPESIARVVAVSALTGIMPSSGAGALAYAIPRSPRKGEPKQLNYQLSHRGLNALANRAGTHMVAIPIGQLDEIKMTADGMVEIVSVDFDNPPTTMDDLRGVAVAIKSMETGRTVHFGFVPKKLIVERMQQSDGYRYAEKPGNEWAKDSDPWHKWPVEQSMKTAMHYAIGRGWCVIDDTESVRALQTDIAADTTIDAEFTPASSAKRLTRSAEIVE